jgi:hypothetical protein
MPYWPRSYGNIKAVYAAGWTAAQVPQDLAHAVNQFAAWMYRNAEYGGLGLQHEHLGGYDYQLAQQVLTGTPELGALRQLLSRYRSRAIGGPL